MYCFAFLRFVFVAMLNCEGWALVHGCCIANASLCVGSLFAELSQEINAKVKDFGSRREVGVGLMCSEELICTGTARN